MKIVHNKLSQAPPEALQPKAARPKKEKVIPPNPFRAYDLREWRKANIKYADRLEKIREHKGFENYQLPVL